MVRDPAIVLVLLDTGMRISELCDLRREDYDRATGRLIIEHGKGATPHRFRHTYAINFLRNGGNVLELRALLGHSSMEMVRHYARVAELDLAAAQRRASPADKWKL